MKAVMIVLAVAAAAAPIGALADVSDAAKPIVDTVRAKYPGLKEYCALEDAVRRKEVFTATFSLAQQGKIKGDPKALGMEAGAAIRAECEKLAQSK